MIGTGYVGLVTGVCLSEVGHTVTCIDVDETKIRILNNGKSPIYEPGLEDMISANMKDNRLFFTSSYSEGLNGADIIYIAVGTPSNQDGTADLRTLENAAIEIAGHITKHVIIVTKSTVPIGTNDRIKEIIEAHIRNRSASFDMVSNPEFLREGSAIHDTFNADRIIIGSDNKEAAELIEEVNKPFHNLVFKTSIRSAEMIKYASNAFLATKISFINEIANLCDKLDADIEDVAKGMGLDGRIGAHFLQAGIGYGGSCFPKDTKALMQIAGSADHDFELLKSVIKVNNKQQAILIDKAIQRFGCISGLNIAVLGLSFKPNTDDMREAASLVIIPKLLELGANVRVYDPISIVKARSLLPSQVKYTATIEEAIKDADCALILTEWLQIQEFHLSNYKDLMTQPILFDGRNCYDLEHVKRYDLEYHSIGRPSCYRHSKSSLTIS